MKGHEERQLHAIEIASTKILRQEDSENQPLLGQVGMEGGEADEIRQTGPVHSDPTGTRLEAEGG